MNTKTVRLSVNYYSLTFIIISVFSGIILGMIYQLNLIEALIASFLFWNVGVRGIAAFIANHIPQYADEIAKNYGWEKGQSFQKEIAATDGAFGLLGVLSPFFSKEFGLAAILGFCFCTISSEFSGLSELYHDQKREDHSIAKILIFGMGLDLVVSISILFLTIYQFIRR